MRVIFLLFDSLNRRALESYGGTTVKTPNFTRLAERAVSFDSHYVGSMPCMPTCTLKPQSTPAMTRSRPTRSA